MADLIAGVVFEISSPICDAQQAIADAIKVSRDPVHNKLSRIDPQLSPAMVDDSVTQFAPIIEELDACHPSVLRRCHPKTLEGNQFVPKKQQIEELLTIYTPLPNNTLVFLEPLTKLATHVFPYQGCLRPIAVAVIRAFPACRPTTCELTTENYAN